MRHHHLAILTMLVVANAPGISSSAEVPSQDLERIRLAAPHDAPVKPKRPRKLLVFSKADGYIHDSIPWGAQALRILGEKTSAYTAVLSDDPAMFDREKLFMFDAVVFNNNCGNPLRDPVRRNNLLEFVRSGRGLVGIHCAAHLDWPEYTEMLGGYSINHPWSVGSTVTIKLDEPEYPLVACFDGAPFQHTDEIFQFDKFSREKVRVLLSLDTVHTDMNKPDIKRTDGDFALSWIRSYGQGRVFYCALGHQQDVYWRPAILKHYLAGIQFVMGDLEADAAPRAAATPAAVDKKVLNLVFCCRPDNDLYRVMTAGGKQYPRFDTATQAIQEAPERAGVLMLADGYPKETTPISAVVFEQVAAKRLRLYVEYPAMLPNIDLGKATYVKTGEYGAIVERTVVASDAFGPDLKKMRIMMINDCHYLPVEAKNPHLVLARVEGYDTAVYGLPKDTHPILFEHPRGDILVATTKLSQFVTGRYAPTEAWAPVWRMIFGWLQPGQTAPTLTWTPTVRPSFGKSEPLPVDAQQQAIRRGVEYYGKSRLYVHPLWPKDTGIDPIPTAWPIGDGTHGIGECYISKRIFSDGSQAVSRSVRADCNLEAAMGLACGVAALEEPKYEETVRKLCDLVFLKSNISQGSRADPKSPSYGLLCWDTNSEGYWGDDNARGLLSAIAAAAMLKSDQWNEPIVRSILANFRTSGPKGFRPQNISEADLQKNGWRHYCDLDHVDYCPHMQAWLWGTYLWLYDKTKYEPLLERARTGLTMMMRAYPNWRLEANRVEQERCRMLLPLAWLVRTDDTPEHRQWLDTIARYIIDLQDVSGAIPQIPGRIVASNEGYGTGECALTHESGDPATDALYAVNFAFIGMHEAAAVTGDARYAQSAAKMADFFIRTQTRSESHPELDGTWYRGVDFHKWDYWASDGDAGWGVWTNEIGWTHSWITATLTLRQMKTSLWELTKTSRIAKQFDGCRSQMLPDEPIQSRSTSVPYVSAEKNLDPAWVQSLFERGERKIYRGKELETIGMPCGGVGAGQLYVRGDGTLAQWWIDNSYHDTGYGHPGVATTRIGAYPIGYSAKANRPPSPVDQGFAISVKNPGSPAVVRRLSRDDFDDIGFIGEYPIATILYGTKDGTALPLEIRGEIFTPWVPLDTRDSANPATIVRYAVRNTSDQPVEVALGGWLTYAPEAFHRREKMKRAGSEQAREDRRDETVGNNQKGGPPASTSSPSVTPFWLLPVRVTWFLIGPIALFLILVKIIGTGSGWLTVLDALFWGFVGLIVCCRWFDLRSGIGTTASGEPATWSDFRRYAPLMPLLSMVAWITANVLGNHILGLMD